MNFILQTENGKLTLDMCFQMERAKEYWDQNDKDNSFNVIYSNIDQLLYETHSLNPEEWCPVGSIDFIEKYIRAYFSNTIANNVIKPLNVPECFLDNKMNTGRYIENIMLSKDYLETDDDNSKYLFKDNEYINNPLNGVMTTKEAFDKGLKNVQVSTLIKDRHDSSHWRVFIHNGEAVDIKHIGGDPFVFPNMDDVIHSYIYQLEGTIEEGVLDVYVDELDEETYVLECHKILGCELYGFDKKDILPEMYWKTYQELINFKN